jgi:hypothetical protein
MMIAFLKNMDCCRAPAARESTGGSFFSRQGIKIAFAIFFSQVFSKLLMHFNRFSGRDCA